MSCYLALRDEGVGAKIRTAEPGAVVPGENFINFQTRARDILGAQARGEPLIIDSEAEWIEG